MRKLRSALLALALTAGGLAAAAPGPALAATEICDQYGSMRVDGGVTSCRTTVGAQAWGTGNGTELIIWACGNAQSNQVWRLG